MATAYYRPGVFIEEVDKGAKPIQGVSTSVAVFAGYTAKAEKLEEDGITTRSILGEPTLVTDWGQYQRHFGSYHRDAYLPLSVRGFFDNGGGRCYIISVKAMNSHRAQVLIKGTDDKTKKELPVLMVRAKKGGTAGNDIQVTISGTAEADVEDKKKDKERIAHPFKIEVHGTPEKTPEEKAEIKKNAEATKGDAEQKKTDAETELGNKKEEADTLADEVKALKEKWEGKADLDTPDDQWTEVSKKYKGADKAQLNPDRESYKQKQNEQEAASKAVDAAQEAVNAAQASIDKATEDLETLKNGKGANPSLTVCLDDLPLWGDPDPKAQKVVEKQGNEHVEVWRLHKSGREAAILPDVIEKEALGKGSFSFDYEYLEEIGQLTGADKKELATKEDKIFGAKAEHLYQGSEPARKGIDGLGAFDDVNLICMPDLMKAYDSAETTEKAEDMIKSVQEKVLTFCQNAHYPFAILDAPKNKDAQGIADWRMNTAGFDSMHGALYYPWIKVTDPFDAKRKIEIPPCGHIAGIYARSDTQRGVHKAPANETVNNAVDLARHVTNGEQEMLNPIGVNCIRKFSGRGIRVWGARTLAMTDPAWRYINVRRLFSYVEASVERSTQWAVFEPNDFALWAKIRRDVTAFLRTVWLSGALFGQSPEQAFYVKCDEETNPSELRDLGQMICEIGMAPVKPAEFVIFRFSQWTDQAEV